MPLTALSLLAGGPERHGAARAAAAWRLLLQLALVLLAARRASARAVEIRFDGRPNQINGPWAMTYTWSTPTKTVWPSTLAFTASEGGKSYFTVTTLRTTSVIAGALQGFLFVTRNSADESGGATKALVVNQPVIELWQANGPDRAPVRVATANCIWEADARTTTLQTPGTEARCTYTFNAPFSYDPEQDGELRVPQVIMQHLLSSFLASS